MTLIDWVLILSYAYIIYTLHRIVKKVNLLCLANKKIPKSWFRKQLELAEKRGKLYA